MASTSLAKQSTPGQLSKYDPVKGVKQIAVAEMAIKHYAKAKDADKLKEAIRAKLTAQAEFVLWWDTKGPGANHGGKRERSGRAKSK